MKITRRGFGIALLLGIGSLILMRIGAVFGLGRRHGASPARAMFWTGGDRLAG